MKSNVYSIVLLDQLKQSRFYRHLLLVSLFCLASALWAWPPAKASVDSIPVVRPTVAPNPTLSAGLETDIGISPNLGVVLPLPRLPERHSGSILISAFQKPVMSAVGLPFPRTRLDPAVLSPARNVQVNAAAARSKPRSNNAVGSLGTKNVQVPKVTPAPREVDNASARANAVANVMAPSIKTPAPLHRSSQPAHLVSPTPAPVVKPIAQATATPPPAVDSQTAAFAIDDPHALPEYSLVQLPGQSPVPMPAQSLTAKAQDLDGLQGQSLSIKLAGRGWIYTGTGKTPAGVSYIEKSVQSDAEQFRFRLDEIGRLVLQFQRQDVASGLLDRENVSVTVRSRMPVSNNNGMKVQASSTNLTGVGSYQPEYPVPQESALRIQNTAQSSNKIAVPDQAATVPVNVQTNADELTVAQLPNEVNALYKLGLQREGLRQSTSARLCYEKILADFPSFGKTDDTLFRLAGVLENAREGRDIRRAYELYVRILDEYPYSARVEAARDRSRFLKRTFFQQ